MPPSEALAATGQPNGPEVWAALLTEFAGELGAVEVAPGNVHQGEIAELDDAGVPWVPRLGGRANLGPELDRVARAGRWDRVPPRWPL